MDPYLLAVLARERRAELLRAREGRDVVCVDVRALAAKFLRASGDRLFRWGVALEPGA
jgi:hypothetical protein